MTRAKEELLVFDFRSINRTRPLFEDEAMLYDKTCPICEKEKLIFKWNWQTHSYDYKARCSGLRCHYGNTVQTKHAAHAILKA